MKVVVDNKIPYINGVLEPFMDVEYVPGNEISAKDVQDADALIIRTRTICNQELLEGSAVKFIATATIGFDHIDVDYCQKAGITWTNAPGCNSGSVKQYIASALAYLAQKHDFEFEARTLGVIGVGNVGSKVTSVAEAIGMRVVQNDPPRERNEGTCGFISLDGLIRESDIVSFHTPLNMTGEDKTYHLADMKLMNKFNNKTILINSSRGEIIDNQDLKNGLINKEISGAVIDVWEDEPEIDLELLNMVDIATPHIAGYSKDGKANGTSMSVQALSRFFQLGVMDTWTAEGVPLPDKTSIEVNCHGKSNTEILSEIIFSTYDISFDHQLLRKKPGDFEKQRGNYPLRREFHVYDVYLNKGNQKLKEIINELGFKSVN